MNRKVVIRLTGGLGNQMHQLCYAYLLANKVNADILIDKEFLLKYSKYLNITYRDFELDKFNFNYSFYNSILSYQFLLRIIKAFGASHILLGFFKIRVLSRYIPLKSLDAHSFRVFYLDGIMGNYLDYENHVVEINSIFKISNKFSELVRRVNFLINKPNSVSIHIRRSDYTKPGSIHHVLDMSYYQDAINYIQTMVQNPFFYIFSDDNSFCELYFNSKNHMYVKSTGDYQDFFDFIAMKSCKHHIIANSTYSWWAAFLGTTPDTIIIAPSLYLKIEPLDIHTNYPPSWVVI